MATRLFWLASYPRSGNTWLRVLLANALYGDVQDSRRVAELVPNIHFGVTGRHLMQSGYTIIKTHWPCRQDLPLRSEIAGAIYLLRHPADVMASAIRYQYMIGSAESRLQKPIAIRQQARLWAQDFLAKRGSSHWHKSGFGGWDGHVASWTESNRAIQVHVVRYEDLKAETADRLAAICKFIGVDVKPARIAAAVARSSMQQMRKLEQAELDGGLPYLFHGRVGATSAASRIEFNDSANSEVGRLLAPTDDEKAAVRKTFATTMERFGYD